MKIKPNTAPNHRTLCVATFLSLILIAGCVSPTSPNHAEQSTVVLRADDVPREPWFVLTASADAPTNVSFRVTASWILHEFSTSNLETLQAQTDPSCTFMGVAANHTEPSYAYQLSGLGQRGIETSATPNPVIRLNPAYASDNYDMALPTVNVHEDHPAHFLLGFSQLPGSMDDDAFELRFEGDRPFTVEVSASGPGECAAGPSAFDSGIYAAADGRMVAHELERIFGPGGRSFQSLVMASDAPFSGAVAVDGERVDEAWSNSVTGEVYGGFVKAWTAPGAEVQLVVDQYSSTSAVQLLTFMRLQNLPEWLPSYEPSWVDRAP